MTAVTMTAATPAAADSNNQAPLRTAIEISGALVINALESFRQYNKHTAKFVGVAQDGLSASLSNLEPYYQPAATKLNSTLFSVDEKLAPIVNNMQLQQQRIAAYTKEFADVRVTPLVEKARAERTRLVTYTTEAVHNANQTARTTIETQTARTQEALAQLLETLRIYAAELEANTPYAADLRKRISELIVAAVSLSQQTRAYIEQRAEPARDALHQRLDFVATEIESRLLKGEATTVEVNTLVKRVQALLTAATEAVATATVKGVRNVSSFVAITHVEEQAVAAADSEPAAPAAAAAKKDTRAKKSGKKGKKNKQPEQGSFSGGAKP